jgi:hypothetical protein
MHNVKLRCGSDDVSWSWRLPDHDPASRSRIDFELQILGRHEELSEFEDGAHQARCRWTLAAYEDDERSYGIGDTCDLEYTKFNFSNSDADTDDVVKVVKQVIETAQKSAISRLKEIDEDWEDR